MNDNESSDTITNTLAASEAAAILYCEDCELSE